MDRRRAAPQLERLTVQGNVGLHSGLPEGFWADAGPALLGRLRAVRLAKVRLTSDAEAAALVQFAAALPPAAELALEAVTEGGRLPLPTRGAAPGPRLVALTLLLPAGAAALLADTAAGPCCWPHLERLGLQVPASYGAPDSAVPCDGAALEALARRCPRLTELSLRGMPRAGEALAAFARHCPRVEAVEAEGCAGLTGAGVLAALLPGGEGGPVALPLLRSLELGPIPAEEEAAVARALAARCPRMAEP